MKKTKITALLIVLGASLALAQGPRGKHHRGDMMKNHIAHMDSIVHLTDEQKTEITSLNDALKIEMKEARENEDREAMKTLRQQHKENIKSVLTPEQLELLKASKEAHRADMKEMRTEMKKYKKENIVPTLKLKRAEFDKNLTEEEKATISDLRIEMKDLRKEHKDSSHGPRAKFNKEQRTMIKEKMQSSLDPIVLAHSSELTQIQTDLEPLKETWEADMTEIKEKHTSSCEGKCNKKGGKHKKGGKDAHMKDKSSMKSYKFLMMKFE
jgi:hypothetical protein